MPTIGRQRHGMKQHAGKDFHNHGHNGQSQHHINAPLALVMPMLKIMAMQNTLAHCTPSASRR